MDTKGLAMYADQAFKATIGLVKMVPEDKLDWRPDDTNNWLTVGQLLAHLPTATGFCMNMFVTGEWPEMPESEMIPPAEKMPTVSSVSEAVEKLEADRQLAAKLLEELSEEDYSGKMVAAPWNPTPMPLWVQLLAMVEHQINHKAALFAYLKLLGVPVNTMHLYGMA